MTLKSDRGAIARLACAGVLTGFSTLMAATPAIAQSGITYVVSQQIGSGSVVGQIGTDGTTGTLTSSNIKSWTLALNGKGATFSITDANSAVVVQGNALTATPQSLSFDYSSSGSNLLLFQQGLYSGNHYWCNANSAGACAQGASVVPNSAFDSAAIFEPRSGVQVLGMASGAAPTTPVGPINVTTTDELNQSLYQLALSQQAQLITANLVGKLLLGKNDQVSCGNCGSAGLSFGSFSASAHGRKALTPELTALFGLAFGRYEEKGAFVTDSYTFAGGLRYDPADMGSSRPYFEVGAAIAPGQKASYRRAYLTGAGMATGAGATRTSNISAYARAGWVARLNRRDEVGGSLSLGHSWQTQRSYDEATGSGNPFAAQYNGGLRQMSMAGLSAQYTHLFGRRIEVGVDAGISRSFGSHSSIAATIAGFGQGKVDAGEITNFEPGARIGVRLSRRVKIDSFINATIANQSIGTSKHGGFAFGLSF